MAIRVRTCNFTFTGNCIQTITYQLKAPFNRIDIITKQSGAIQSGTVPPGLTFGTLISDV